MVDADAAALAHISKSIAVTVAHIVKFECLLHGKLNSFSNNNNVDKTNKTNHSSRFYRYISNIYILVIMNFISGSHFAPIDRWGAHCSTPYTKSDALSWYKAWACCRSNARANLFRCCLVGGFVVAEYLYNFCARTLGLENEENKQHYISDVCFCKREKKTYLEGKTSTWNDTDLCVHAQLTKHFVCERTHFPNGQLLHAKCLRLNCSNNTDLNAK